MKKLLSLLIVLTISVIAIPTTIAASYYQKEEIIRIKRENGGINKVEYGGVYWNIYLDHKVASQIHKNIDVAGWAATIGSILLSSIIIGGPAGLIIGACAPIIIAQWKIWKSHKYDNGNGIIMTFAGIAHSSSVNF